MDQGSSVDSQFSKRLLTCLFRIANELAQGKLYLSERKINDSESVNSERNGSSQQQDVIINDSESVANSVVAN